MRREQLRRSHRLELALTCPVCNAAEMVDVAVADHDRGHGRQSAVGAARVEGEVKLRQQNHGPVSCTRSADDDQLAP
jgi:transcription elongation factor Elf1